MDFNTTNDLLKTNDEAQKFFNSLDADTQKQLLDKYTNVSNIDDLKTFASVIVNHI